MARSVGRTDGHIISRRENLADLLWPGKVQCRLLARRQVTEVIDRRSSVLLDKSLMVITRIVQPQDWRSVLINAVLGEVKY
jgi:hypothetical protein